MVRYFSQKTRPLPVKGSGLHCKCWILSTALDIPHEWSKFDLDRSQPLKLPKERRIQPATPKYIEAFTTTRILCISTCMLILSLIHQLNYLCSNDWENLIEFWGTEHNLARVHGWYSTWNFICQTQQLIRRCRKRLWLSKPQEHSDNGRFQQNRVWHYICQKICSFQL